MVSKELVTMRLSPGKIREAQQKRTLGVAHDIDIPEFTTLVANAEPSRLCPNVDGMGLHHQEHCPLSPKCDSCEREGHL